MGEMKKILIFFLRILAHFMLPSCFEAGLLTYQGLFVPFRFLPRAWGSWVCSRLASPS